MTALVEVCGLTVDFDLTEGSRRVLDAVDFQVEAGRITAVVGESGSGKSTLSNALLGLLPSNGRIGPDSRILFGGRDTLRMSAEALRQFRWRQAALVFQAAQSALNPTLTVREQLFDSVLDHGDRPDQAPYPERLERLLGMVRLEPTRVLSAYPHQLSGGMRQRVIMAMALMLEPELLILDEPTTALDVITQSYVFDILEDIHQSSGLTMLFITHDLGAVSRLAHQVVVLYGGHLVERASVEALFARPRHPYSQELLGAQPSLAGELVLGPVPEVSALPPGRTGLRPVPGVSALPPGQTGLRPVPGVSALPPGQTGLRPNAVSSMPWQGSGCVFQGRCPYVQERCRRDSPTLEDAAPDHQVACLRLAELP